MKLYMRALLIAGVFIPMVLHVASPERMPWWPDTVSLGIAFGAAAVAIVWQVRADRETNRRLWDALRIFGAAIGRHFRSN
jgi:hypothetical protein